ncbi:copper resistance CopC/CopD family protein [Candidatus Poriferisodalis sp.]|uniref:copper resistance CopC/CopD family protein n=1 Tax=Candidatus Poriferisodalis sp. TaxID=3101277 RepID=UPI003B02DB61
MTLRPAVALVLTFALSFVLLGSLQRPVGAHTGLESSQPAEGETINEPVSAVSLTFNRPVEPAGSGLGVFDEHGVEQRPSSLGSADGQTWVLRFETPLSGGDYEVRWRVATEDGHIVEGTFRFTADAPHAGSAAEPSADSAAASVADSTDQIAASADVDEESPDATSGTGTARTGSTTAATDLDSVRETSSMSTMVPSGSETLDTTTSETSDTAAESRPLLRSAGAAGAGRFAEAARVLGLLATLAIVGGLAFASFIVRGELSERARVHRVLPISGTVLVVAAVAAGLTQAVVLEDDWAAIVSLSAIADALSAPFGIAVGLRVLGGLAVLAAPPPEALGAGRARLPAVSLISGALVIVSYSFDGHTVTEGPRWLHAAANATHVYAAAVWSGGLALLADLLRRRRGGADVVRPLMRFSQLASVSLVMAAVGGTIMAVLVLDRFADLWSTAWGRLLIAKIALVAAAVFLGARNRWVHLPVAAQVVGQPPSGAAYERLRRTVVTEAIALGCVGVVTAFLVGASAL